MIGAGGTARAASYAVKKLGLDLIIYNRTPEKAFNIAEKFDGRCLESEDLYSNDPKMIELWGNLDVVISTIPAKANFTLPQTVLSNKPLVLDAVYSPPRTPLLNQALENGCSVIQGATMLLEQGIQQFELWNQRTAPRKQMSSIIFQDLDLLH